MIKKWIGLLIITSFAVALNTGAPALAQAKLPTATIAVVDSQLIRRESAAGKDISRQINTFRSEVQAQLQKEEEALKEEEAELRRQRAVLTPEAFDEKRRGFEQKVLAVQKKVQDKNQQLQIALNKAIAELDRALLPILQNTLEAKNATLIFDKSQIIVQKPGLDITTEVIEKLDRSLPSVKVELDSKPANTNQ